MLNILQSKMACCSKTSVSVFCNIYNVQLDQNFSSVFSLKIITEACQFFLSLKFPYFHGLNVTD